jgi:hypothetical protein
MAVYKFKTNSLKTPLKYSSFLAGNAAYDPASFFSIATVTLTGTSTGITFTSIPSTYTHLQLRTVTINSTSGNRLVQVGSSGSVDTGSNYYMHELWAGGSSTTSGSIIATDNIQMFYAPPSSTALASSVTDILDYTNTNKTTLLKSFGGADLNGSGRITLSSGYWSNTATINTLKVYPSGGNFEAGSRFALYGIKGV